MLSYPLSSEHIEQLARDFHPNFEIASITIQYIQHFVTPLFNVLNTLTVKKSLDEYLNSMSELTPELIKYSLMEANQIYNSLEEEGEKDEKIKLQQYVYAVVKFFIGELVNGAGNVNFKYYNQEVINDSHLFLAIFEDRELRWFFLKIMPSEIKSGDTDAVSLALASEIGVHDYVIDMVVSMFINYLSELYENNYQVLLNNIKNKYPESGEPISFTLIKNIKDKAWNLEEVKYYIISMYDNDIITWRQSMEYKLPTTWDEKLIQWSEGKYLKPPANISSFMWRTTPIIFDDNSKYKELFVPATFNNTPDNNTFSSYMVDDRSAFIIWNAKKDTKMVIPGYRPGKNFANLAMFMKEADIKQQEEFWKTVALAIKEELVKMAKGQKLYISTHGFGVSYLHVRIEHDKPKYFDPAENASEYQ